MRRASGLELRPVIGPGDCPPTARGVRAFVGGGPSVVGRASVAIPDPLISRTHASIEAVSINGGVPTLKLTCLSKNPIQIIVDGCNRIISSGHTASLSVNDTVKLYAGGPCTFSVALLENDDSAVPQGRVGAGVASTKSSTLVAAAAGVAVRSAPEFRGNPLQEPLLSESAPIESSRSHPVGEPGPEPRRERNEHPILPAACSILQVAVEENAAGCLPKSQACDESEARLNKLIPDPLPPSGSDSAKLRSPLRGIAAISDGPSLGREDALSGLVPSSDPARAPVDEPVLSPPQSAPRRVNTVFDRRLSTFQQSARSDHRAAPLGAGTSPYFPRYDATSPHLKYPSVVPALQRDVILASGAAASADVSACSKQQASVVDLTDSPMRPAPLPRLAGAAERRDNCSAAPPTATEIQAGDPSEDLCPICREVMQGRVSVGLLPCAHTFCFDCIVAWSGITNHCCLCKREFGSILELRRSSSGLCRKSASSGLMAQAPAAFRSWASVRSYVVTARRQAMVHHLDDDAALAHDLAMEEGALLDADAGQWGDDVESEGAAHSVVVLSEDDDAGAVEDGGWIEPRRAHAGPSLRGRGRDRRRGDTSRHRDSRLGRRSYFVESDSSTSSEEDGAASGFHVHSDGRDYNCCVCHSDRNPDVLLLCDGCDTPQHTFCCSPVLDEVPEGLWLCSRCCARHVAECPALPRPLFVQRLQAEAAANTAKRLTENAGASFVVASAAARATSAIAPVVRSASAPVNQRSAAFHASSVARVPPMNYDPARRLANERRSDQEIRSAHVERGRHASSLLRSSSASASAGSVLSTGRYGATNHYSVPHREETRPPHERRRARESRSYHGSRPGGINDTRDQLRAALEQSRMARAQPLPRGDFAHMEASDSPHMLLPAAQLAAEQSNMDRHTSSSLQAYGPPITRIVSADSDADESTGTETRQGAYSQHRRIRPKASRRPLKRLRRHGSKGGTPSTNTASFHVGPGSDRYDDGDSEHSDLSMALGEN